MGRHKEYNKEYQTEEKKEEVTLNDFIKEENKEE